MASEEIQYNCQAAVPGRHRDSEFVPVSCTLEPMMPSAGLIGNPRLQEKHDRLRYVTSPGSGNPRLAEGRDEPQ